MKNIFHVPRWRIIILAILFAAPFAFLMGYGSYQLWVNGWMFWFSWPMLICLALAYFLAWRWQATKKLLKVDFDVPLHWTKRDEQAWELVKARAEASRKLDQEKLGNIQFYLETGQEMALELARFYNPNAKDPISSLTVPEILAVVELATHDLAEMTQQYLPGGHLLTVGEWKKAKQLTDWYQTASNVYWAVSAVFNPFNTALRYLATKVGMGTPLQLLQQNLFLWFYTAFVHRLGTYLIDLNSGRLRVGAERYRLWLKTLKEADGREEKREERIQDGDGKPEPQLPSVTLTLIGQVKAGKSSLINALLGDQKAKTNVLPETQSITVYELMPEAAESPLQLLDTVGYGHEGPREDQLRETEKASQKSDLLLFVLHGLNPARHADLEVLKKLRTWFEKRHSLKMPPVLAVLTHIDLLSPKMEWQPPYDWTNPKRTKEKQIHEAMVIVKEQLGDHIVGVIPICGAEGKVYGIEEWLLPAITRLLDQSRAVAMLRCLNNEADAGKIRKVFDQFLAASKTVLKGLWELK